MVRGAVPIAHCLGNHDLNVESRERALEILYGGETSLVSGAKTPTSELSYFSRKLPRGWRLVVLDTTELNPRWAPVGSEAQRRCEAFVEERNDVSGNAGLGESRRKTAGRDAPRALKTLGRGYRRDADGMAACDVSVGGGKRRARRRRVARALSRTAARPGMAAWNCDEVSALLEASPAVALCVAGHDHPGRYGRTLVPSAQLHSGYKTFGRVHYVTLEAMLEAPADGNAFAALEVYDHEVIVNAGGAARGVLRREISLSERRDNRKPDWGVDGKRGFLMH